MPRGINPRTLARQEEIRKRLKAGESVDHISEAMNASKSTVYKVKKENRQLPVVHGKPGGLDLNHYWVTTTIIDGRGKPITNVACPLPSYKLGLDLALKSAGLKL